LANFQVSFQALFDTGAARSIIHESLFKKSPLQSRDTCSTLDFDLYDVHNKKLNTLGKVTFPIRYGRSTLLQEFIITDGISEGCILGWDAIRKHGFTVDGETNSIYSAKETLGQAKSPAPDISMILHKRRHLPSHCGGSGSENDRLVSVCLPVSYISFYPIRKTTQGNTYPAIHR
jgi:hypothetical protein